jgi:hypothetical protein
MNTISRKIDIFGTGSIACRHSRVLHRLGFVVDAFAELSILEESPVRYWQFENHAVKFYGEIPLLKKEVLVVTADMIESSYEAMWKNIVDNNISRFENMNLTETLYREFI